MADAGGPPVTQIATPESSGEIIDDALLRRVVRDAPIGLCIVAPDGGLLQVNPAVCDLFGLPAHVLVTRTWQQLTHPDDLEADLAQVQRVLDGEIDRYHLTKRYLRPDGAVFVGDLSVSAVRDADGLVQCFVSQIVDVTAATRTEQALRRSRDDYRVLAENASDVVYRSDSAGRCTWISPSVESELGWRADQMVGTRPQDLIHPDDRPRALAAVTSAVVAQIPLLPVLELRYRQPDGEYRWMNARARAFFDADGRVEEVITALRDVHEQVSARVLLQTSQELLRGTVETLLDPWVLLDPVRDETGRIVDFVYVDANAAACAANLRTRDDLLGQRLLELFPAHATNGLLQQYSAVIDTGEPLAMDDYPFVAADGVLYRFDNRAVATAGRLSLSWRDVTDRFEARMHLARLATQDPLTGLANRMHLMDRMTDMFDRIPRTGTLPAVLFIDLDRFKEVNDTLGHPAGDEVLREVASRVTATVRAQDLVARLGGDEFVVVLDGVHDATEAGAIAEKLRRAAAEPIRVGSREVRVTASVGVALGGPDDDADRVIRAADTALYRAKESGRDRVVTLAG